jgi:lambda family phage minor tail protein L
MSIELAQLNHDSVIELFDLDLSSVLPGQAFYFCNFSYQGFQLAFRGRIYVPTPIMASKFSISAGGQAETATLVISNINTGLMPLIRQYNDLVNCQLVRRRVFFKNMDGQIAANPNAVLEESYWYLDRVEYNKMEVRWELRRLRDMGNYQLPGRVVAANLCGFQYRRWTGSGFDYSGTSECAYSGAACFDLNDNPTDQSRDSCGHTLASCELRKNARRFGGFPGAGQINYAN